MWIASLRLEALLSSESEEVLPKCTTPMTGLWPLRSCKAVQDIILGSCTRLSTVTQTTMVYGKVYQPYSLNLELPIWHFQIGTISNRNRKDRSNNAQAPIVVHILSFKLTRSSWTHCRLLNGTHKTKRRASTGPASDRPIRYVRNLCARSRERESDRWLSSDLRSGRRLEARIIGNRFSFGSLLVGSSRFSDRNAFLVQKALEY